MDGIDQYLQNILLVASFSNPLPSICKWFLSSKIVITDLLSLFQEIESPCHDDRNDDSDSANSQIVFLACTLAGFWATNCYLRLS